MDARRSWPQGPRPSSASRDPSSSRMAQSSRDASSAHAKEYSQAHDPRSSIQARHVGDRREFNSNHGQSRDLFRTEARAERSDDDEFSTPSPPPKIKQEEESNPFMIPRALHERPQNSRRRTTAAPVVPKVKAEPVDEPFQEPVLAFEPAQQDRAERDLEHMRRARDEFARTSPTARDATKYRFEESKRDNAIPNVQLKRREDDTRQDMEQDYVDPRVQSSAIRALEGLDEIDQQSTDEDSAVESSTRPRTRRKYEDDGPTLDRALDARAPDQDWDIVAVNRSTGAKVNLARVDSRFMPLLEALQTILAPERKWERSAASIKQLTEYIDDADLVRNGYTKTQEGVQRYVADAIESGCRLARTKYGNEDHVHHYGFDVLDLTGEWRQTMEARPAVICQGDINVTYLVVEAVIEKGPWPVPLAHIEERIDRAGGNSAHLKFRIREMIRHGLPIEIVDDAAKTKEESREERAAGLNEALGELRRHSIRSMTAPLEKAKHFFKNVRPDVHLRVGSMNVQSIVEKARSLDCPVEWWARGGGQIHFT